MSIINVDVDKCVGCNACVRACPVGDANVAQMDENGKYQKLQICYSPKYRLDMFS